MLICRFDKSLPENQNGNITQLFYNHRAQNVYHTIAAAWENRILIPINRMNDFPINIEEPLSDNRERLCNRNDRVLSSPLQGCAMVMAYNADRQDAYVCHVAGGLLQSMSAALKRRVGDKILLIARILSAGGNAVDLFYSDIVNRLLEMGYRSSDICLIDGEDNFLMVGMSGSGDFAVM